MELALTIFLTVVLGVLGFPILVGQAIDLLTDMNKRRRLHQQRSNR